MSTKQQEPRMDSSRGESRRGSVARSRNDNRKSVFRVGMIISKPKTQIGKLIKERSMSSDMDSNDMRPFYRKVRYENTYRLEPKDEEKFSCSRMERAMGEILSEIIGEERYDPVTCNSMANTISNRIKDTAKIYPWKRYRFVVHVIVGQNSNTSIKIASRCVWDDSRDNFATAKYENKEVFATATCYAVYLD